MSALIAFIVSLCLTVVAIVGTRSASRTLLHPAVIFSSVWLFVFAVLPLRILPYFEIRDDTYVLILAANTAVVTGALFQLVRMRRNKTRPPSTGQDVHVQLMVLGRAIRLFMFAGCFLFALFIFIVGREFGFSALLTTPHIVRSGFSGIAIQLTIKYFYFTTPAAAMAFIHLTMSRRHRRRMLAVILLSLAMSIATTGRTAPITILVWLVFVRVFVPSRRRVLENTKKLTLALVTCAAVALVFVYGGNWIGKTFDNSGFQRKISVESTWNVSVIPYYYFTASVPALNNLLIEPAGLTFGTYTFLPLAKIVFPLVNREAPSEISPETFVPYSANTYTYAYPFLRDFGVAGLILGSVVMGLITEGSYLRMVRANRSIAAVLRNAFLAKCLVFTFGTNHFCSPFTWWCIGLTYVLGACVSHARNKRDVPARVLRPVMVGR